MRNCAVCCSLAVALCAAEGMRADAPVDCWPGDGLRVRIEAPEAIAKRVRELIQAEKEATAREALRGQFAAAGCSAIDEQAAADESEPNLVCTLTGKRPDRIVVGTSPEYDGLHAAALLPALVEVLRQQPRELTFQMVAFGSARGGGARGPAAFVDSLPASSTPALFVHVGAAGFGAPAIEPETSPQQQCLLEAIAIRLAINLLPRARRRVGAECEPEPQGRLTCGQPFALPSHPADRAPFIRRGIEVAGIEPELSDEPGFDAPSHYASYRLLAAFMNAADLSRSR